MIGAGGVYASAEDMAKFIQLHLSFGRYAGKQILRSEHLIELYKPIMVENYALGIAVIDEAGTYALNHNGGGFGFGSSMKWFPEYNIGCIILTNSEYSHSVYQTVSMILDEHVKRGFAEKDTASVRFNPIFYFRERKDLKNAGASTSTVSHCVGDSVYHPSWDKYVGTYPVEMGGGFEFTWYGKIVRMIGVKMSRVKVFRKDKGLYLNYHNGSFFTGEQRLVEHLPGLFFTSEGEALDFRNNRKTYRSIELK